MCAGLRSSRWFRGTRDLLGRGIFSASSVARLFLLLSLDEFRESLNGHKMIVLLKPLADLGQRVFLPSCKLNLIPEFEKPGLTSGGLRGFHKFIQREFSLVRHAGNVGEYGRGVIVTHMCVLTTLLRSFFSEKFHSPIGRRTGTAERRIGFPGLHRSQLAWALSSGLKKSRDFGLGHAQAVAKIDELFSVGQGFLHRSSA